MRFRHLLFSLFFLLPSLCWGQNTFVTEKLAQAEEIKSSKGICPEYIDILFEARDIAMREGENSASISICEDILYALQKVFPQETELIQTSKLYLALLCSEMDDHEKALPLLKDCYNNVKGKDYEIERVLLSDIVTAHYSLGDLSEAINYQRQLNSLTLKNEGKGYKYAGGLFWISTFYMEEQNKKDAIRVLKEALDILESANLTNDRLYNDTKYRYELLTTGTSSAESETAVIRKNHEYIQQFVETKNLSYIEDAITYLADKDYVHSIDTLRHHTLTILEQYYFEKNDYHSILGTVLRKPYWDSHDYFISAYCEEAEGHFDLAREGYKQAMAHAFLEKHDVSDSYFLYFDNYSRSCIQTGRYQEVFLLLEQFYAQEVVIPGYESRAALYMAMLAQLKYSINDFNGAIGCVDKCAPLFLKIGDIDDYISTMMLAAASHEQLGDFEAYSNVLRDVLSVYQSSEDYFENEASIKIALASYYAQSGQKEQAADLVSSVLTRYSSHRFSDFWAESVFHNALGHYYQLCEDNQAAEKEYRIGANLLKENAPENDSNYPQQLAAMAYMYLQWPGNESKALPIYEEAFQLTKKYHDASYPPFLLYYLGVIASKFYNEIPVSDLELVDFINAERLQAQNLLFQMSVAEREAFWRNHGDIKDIVFSFSDRGITPTVLYDYALFYKGLLLSSSTQIGKIISSANNDELNSLFGQYCLVNQDKDDSRKSTGEIERLEHKILEKCQELGYSINETVTVADIASSLNENSVALEFVDYKQPGSVSDPLDKNRYAALIMRKDWPNPKLVDLGFAEGLETVVQVKDKAYSKESLYELVWKPLEQYISIGDTVYYSPAGLLHQVAFEAIPVSNGVVLSDCYSLVRLSSTREICNKSVGDMNYSTSVVYGGLQYSLSDEDMLSNSKLYSYSSTPTSEDYLTRGGDNVSPWRFLPGTRAEAEAVNALLVSNHISSTLFIGASGNEESFKALSGQSPSIIHVATHGFYLQNQDFHAPDNSGSDMKERLQAQKSAMKRSGLIMSGANPAWTEGRILPNVEDGILTAEEISYLDFRNTSLAIISACDSGLGEINNDGVEGLQRAFKSAGVQTLVVTLWKVDDSATELMMTEFYKSLTKGFPRREAFDLARSAVKSRYPEPFYWAPFVMID